MDKLINILFPRHFLFFFSPNMVTLVLSRANLWNWIRLYNQKTGNKVLNQNQKANQTVSEHREIRNWFKISKPAWDWVGLSRNNQKFKSDRASVGQIEFNKIMADVADWNHLEMAWAVEDKRSYGRLLMNLVLCHMWQQFAHWLLICF